jgi:hypothetical protein
MENRYLFREVRKGDMVLGYETDLLQRPINEYLQFYGEDIEIRLLDLVSGSYVDVLYPAQSQSQSTQTEQTTTRKRSS